MNATRLQALLIRQLDDIYSAEQQLTKALFLFASAAHRPELRQTLLRQQFQSQGQQECLEQLFTLLNVHPHHLKCQGMQFLIDEGKRLLSEDLEPFLLDVAMIGAVQRLLHYKIAVYSAAHRYAECLGYPVVAQVLQKVTGAEVEAVEALDELGLDQLNLAEVQRLNANMLA